MATLTPAQIYSLARGAGLSAAGATVATAIALGESGGRTDAQGDVGLQDSKWGPSIGLWQIRSLKAEYGTGGPRDATRLTDPYFNAASMVAISGKGGNWRPWTVFTSGAYKKYLGTVAAETAGGGEQLPESPGLLDQLGSGLSNAIDAINPLDDWARGAMNVGIKLVAGAAVAGLFIAGAIQTIK